MKAPSPTRSGVAATIVVITALASIAALEKGGTAFSKRNETTLRAEPKALAPAVGSAKFAEPLKIDAVQGSWLRVKAAKATGWVFAGNVAEEKPTLPPPAGLTTISASETDTVAAARPLAPAAEGFAERHDADKARADVEWLDTESAKIKGDAVETYLRENKKGEFTS